MHVRGAKPQWQSRRNMSLGPPVRRAHPASGATWNVQVVRGKMTSRCLWHACRALMFGMLLMFVGAGMATIGYYAEDLSVGQEIRGNATVRVKNESRGFHLNNLSYVGPIVMGFGGFIVVAACVMTFEARDSAAKVVPARFKLSTTSRTPRTNSSSRRTTGSAISTSQAGSQTNRWENQLGVFRTSPGTADGTGAGTVTDRKALTAALVHFSRALGSSRMQKKTTSPPKSPDERRVSRSGSVPNMATITAGQRTGMVSQATMTTPPTAHHKSSRHRCSRNSSLVARPTMAERTSPLFLHPTSRLQWYRQALSVDETGFSAVARTRDGIDGSTEMGGTSGRIRDRTKRSDTARRHVLSRQKPIEKESTDIHMHRGNTSRSSTASDVTNVFRKSYSRGSTVAVSRTPSIDSRAVQTDLPCSPELKRHQQRPHSPKRPTYTQWSTPSDEQRECKTQLSTTSEPEPMRYLSEQSSIEPCLSEELSQTDESDAIITAIPHPLSETTNCPKRPDTLILNCSVSQPQPQQPPPESPLKRSEKQKFLYRSNSSRLYKRPKTKVKLENEFDKIYFISSNKDDEYYDSIDVIDERRSSNFKRTGGAPGFCRSSTVIYSEYCSGSVLESTTATPETRKTASSAAAGTSDAMLSRATKTTKSSDCVADRVLTTALADNGVAAGVPVTSVTGGRHSHPNNKRETAKSSSVNDIEVEAEVAAVVSGGDSEETFRSHQVDGDEGANNAVGGMGEVFGVQQHRRETPPNHGLGDEQITTITVRADIEDFSTHSQSASDG